MSTGSCMCPISLASVGSEGEAGQARHLLCEELLVDLAVVHLLLDGSAGDEAVHSHLPPLPNAPGPLPGLHVRGGVPVWIVQQHPAWSSTHTLRPVLTPHVTGSLIWVYAAGGMQAQGLRACATTLSAGQGKM